ncbi:MAG TPA: hypothetical protein VKW78_00420 [Terriglobales bacterium]|nr:hypothetical protein [Terriglobales bacterium]
MKKFFLAFAVVLLIQNCWSAQPVFKPDVPIMPLSQVHAGMKGVAYTVFQGTRPEPMNLVVLGVLKNMNGPDADVILIRLEGAKPEYTGVVAGMSGSPVYIDGKLVGALAFRIGEFSKEPIAGVTPIEQMLEINALDQTSAKRTFAPLAQVASPGPVTGRNGLQNFANLLKPIDTPLVFSGFTEDAVRRFAPQFSAAGITPVMGAGSVTGEKQPDPLVPGSSISAVLVRGDLSIAATCTVTYVDPQRLLACGHPLLQFGNVDIPMNKAEVIATLPSPENAFKIINTTEAVGAFVQDRHTGILGRFDQTPDMIPVTLRIHGVSNPKTFHYEVLSNPKLTPVAIMSTAYSVLQGINEYGEDVTYRLNGRIDVRGYPEVKLENMYAPSDSSVPTAAALAMSLGDRFGRIYDNQFVKPSVTGVELDFDILNERRWARLESARTDVTEARPGDEITIEAALRPYRGERIVKQIPIQIPTSTPQGTLRILVSDADTLDRMRRTARPFAQRLDLASTIALLNKERINDRLYVSLLEQNPEAMVQDKIMPTLPLSVMNVMEGMRGTQEMTVLGESSVGEESTPVDYVVSGAQVITLTIK